MDFPKVIGGAILLIIGLTIALNTENSIGYFLVGFGLVLLGQGLNK